MHDETIKLRQPEADDDTIKLRQPDVDALKAWTRPAAAAFGEDFTDQEIEHDRSLWELDRLIGAVDGETWVSTGGAYTFRLTVPGGGEVGAAGITMIGVTPTHRRRGILRQMMRWLLDQAHERREPLAILWASEGAIYQRFGFGSGTLDGPFDIERVRVRFTRPAEPLGQVRFVNLDEALRLIPPVYDAVRPNHPGWVTRSEQKWRNHVLFDAEWMRHGNGSKFIAVLEVDGVARGYSIYRVKDNWGDQGPNHTVMVMEVIGTDPAVERALWEWLLGIDLVGHIKSWRGPVPHPLMLQFAEPRRVTQTVRDGLWIRILDVAAALKARGFASSGSVSFEVTDEFCPWNAGRWRLDVADGGSGLVTRSADEPDLTLDISDLAAVYLGAHTFTELVRAGRVVECRPGAIKAADALFITASAPWCSTMF